jgi:hypothetical protein
MTRSCHRCRWTQRNNRVPSRGSTASATRCVAALASADRFATVRISESALGVLPHGGSIAAHPRNRRRRAMPIPP